MAKRATAKTKAEMRRLQKLPDEKIDTSDIPERKDWSKAVKGKFLKGKKV